MAVGRWKVRYDTTTASSAEEVVRQVNARGVGWTLVTVTLEPPSAYGRNAKYTAFLEKVEDGEAD